MKRKRGMLLKVLIVITTVVDRGWRTVREIRRGAFN